MNDQVALLKQKIVSCPNLCEAYDFFLKHYGENSGFMESCLRAETSHIENLLQPMWAKSFDIHSSINMKYLLLRYQDSALLHGIVFTPKGLYNLIFFDDQNIGLLAAATDVNNETRKFIRVEIKEDVLPKQHDRYSQISEALLH